MLNSVSMGMRFPLSDPWAAPLQKAAEIAVRQVLALQKDEQLLIITNPEENVYQISLAMFNAAADAGARPVLVCQSAKTQMDFAEKSIMAAFSANPEAVVSLSCEKLGKDERGVREPYRLGDKSWNSVFHYQMYGTKTCRSFWSPGTTLESFCRTVPIDYALLERRSAAIKAVMDMAVSARVRAPGGTDIFVPLSGRLAMCDDGNFRHGGTGGNLPAGECFISPANGGCEGRIVFDGSISLHNGDMLLREPVELSVSGGFIHDIRGGKEASLLRESIELAQKNAIEYEKDGRLEKGLGSEYAKNACNIGELGIGLNPEARISGSMLEDEKAFRTCHFAVGHNYDDDAPALIHLDALVREPDIELELEDGRRVPVLERGELSSDLAWPAL